MDDGLPQQEMQSLGSLMAYVSKISGGYRPAYRELKHGRAQ